MIYGSICSGIEAASVAWHPLGWRPAFFAEIDKFPSAVLAAHYPNVPNLGDFTKIGTDVGPIDLLVGGTPCQSFSIAGKRAGLDDARGNLTLEYLALAGRLRPRWLLWENVPGVLSIDGGRTFGAVLGALEKLGYGFAYRILDAQYFGVPQRRRRVFVVGYLGDWRPAAAVLLERESLRGDSAPRRQAGAGVAALTSTGVGTCGADDNQAQAGHLIAHSLRGEGFDASEDGTGRGTPIIAHALNAKGGAGRSDGDSETFVPVAFAQNSRDELRMIGGDGRIAGALAADEGMKQRTYINSAQYGVRRLTPRECERLQGFPDDYTLVNYRGKPAADGPRYKAIGNSMAVPVMRWLGERIQMVDALLRASEAA